VSTYSTPRIDYLEVNHLFGGFGRKEQNIGRFTLTSEAVGSDGFGGIWVLSRYSRDSGGSI